LPTSVSAESRSEKSQFKNWEIALRLLKARLHRLGEQKQWPADLRPYNEKAKVSWAYQIRNYVLHPYTRVKDVRTDEQTREAASVLDGDLDPFLRAYARWFPRATEQSR
jgi:peptide chain release factor 2